MKLEFEVDYTEETTNLRLLSTILEEQDRTKTKHILEALKEWCEKYIRFIEKDRLIDFILKEIEKRDKEQKNEI